jgi:hypothetical protein
LRNCPFALEHGQHDGSRIAGEDAKLAQRFSPFGIRTLIGSLLFLGSS